ncbi:cysteine-rich receptor-like protein kinase 8 [Macadamia integrifolia]|uniref:cysteine-rich receptor-like protein kinase 8 n=1 Tax=Macadamia integrifolia TaxID=60698 RepID=UPI001C4EA613|nr:cysteine-rich receptor-like protein kinase 8 [Macadamia integrifolia]
MKINDSNTPTTLLLLLPCLILSYNISCTTANPLLFDCMNQNEYLPNSAFESNLKLLLSTISSNTTLLSKGFYNYSVGTGTNQVFGLALCRANFILEDCQTCLEIASREILYLCPKKQKGIIWYDYCQLHYSYQRFFSQMVYAGKLPPWNVHQRNVSNPVQFSKIWKDLLHKLISQVASNSSELKFATEVATIPGNGKVRGRVECASDIYSEDCVHCLEFSLKDLYGCCSSRQGGMVLGSSCNLMFQISTINDEEISHNSPPTNIESQTSTLMLHRNMPQGDRVDDLLELPSINFEAVKVATRSFSNSNKLGQGGFGTVYKGMLPDGKEIAVKRLSRRSQQGLEEFKNEVILIAKLQHRNLVRLLGSGIKGEEKLLIYEFMPNISLDAFIFDPLKRSQLDWRTRHNIIDGIARGLLYLHEGSRVKIIHRDLKTSNILLDNEMTAKISDFGMARIFCEEQNTTNTKRIVGTYGYMSPEYAMEGIFSAKSDVFSFGVILLEIISGKRNNSYLEKNGQTLLTYLWRLREEGKELDFVDPLLSSSCPRTEVLLRYIHIGLLCVQRDPADRPTVSEVIVMLDTDSRDLMQEHG